MLERVGRWPRWAPYAVLIVGCLLLFSPWLGRVPVTEDDEARYTEAVREMIESGNYLIPHCNYVPRYQKPILYYWLQAPSVLLLGENEFAARLPSAIMALLLVLLVYGFLRTWLGKRAPTDDAPARARAGGSAWFGAAALATMPLVAIWAHAAITDSTLTLFITLTLLAFLQADLVQVEAVDPARARKTARGWYLLGAVACGLAVLTKGPVGVAVPVLTWLLYHLRQRSLTREARLVPWPAGVASFLVVAVPWYVATYFYVGWDFLTRFLGYENLERYAGKPMEGHGSPLMLVRLITYLPVALLVLFPYSPFILREILQPFAGNATLREDAVLVRIRRFALAWCVAVVGFFSLSSTQLPHYIQSMAGGAAILFALHLYGRFSPGVQPSRLGTGLEVVEKGLVLLLGILFVGAFVWIATQPGVAASASPLGSVPFPHPAIDVVRSVLLITGLFWLLGVVAWSLLRQPARFLAWTMGGWTLFFLVVLLGLVPLGITSLYTYPRAIGLFLRQQPVSTPVYAYRIDDSEGIFYYARRHVEFYNAVQADFPTIQMLEALREHDTLLLITDETGLQEAARTAHVTPLRHFGPNVVVRVER